MSHTSPGTSASLADLSPYVYGTTRLGDSQIPFDDRVKVARAAMDSGVWFHTSHTYGNALQVLHAAFDEDRAKVPHLIIKIGWNSIDEMKDVIRQNLAPLGLESLDLGQLCLGGGARRRFCPGRKVLRGVLPDEEGRTGTAFRSGGVSLDIPRGACGDSRRLS